MASNYSKTDREAMMKAMKDMDPQVFRNLLEQQLESMRNGKSGLPQAWALGKPLTEEEFKKQKATQGASVIKTVSNKDKGIIEDSKQQQNSNKTIEGTIEEVLARVKAEKEKEASDQHEDSASLRQKLRAKLHAKQARRMTKHAVSNMVSKKMTTPSGTSEPAVEESEQGMDMSQLGPIEEIEAEEQ